MEDVNEFGIPDLEETRVNWRNLLEKLLAASELHLAILDGSADEGEEDPLSATVSEVKAALEPEAQEEAAAPATTQSFTSTANVAKYPIPLGSALRSDGWRKKKKS
jgi:hypothetical protein